MKRLTFVSAGIFALGLLFPLLAAYALPYSILIDIGNILMAIGFLLTFVSLIVWQATVSKTRLIVTSSVLGLIFLAFSIHIAFRIIDLESSIIFCDERSQEAQKENRELEKKLDLAHEKMDDLKQELNECRQSTK